jgi:hypothetical protein
MQSTKKAPEEPRGRGRPVADEPGIRVCTWLKVKEFDRLHAIASHQRSSVSSTMRHLLMGRLSGPSE